MGLEEEVLHLLRALQLPLLALRSKYLKVSLSSQSATLDMPFHGREPRRLARLLEALGPAPSTHLREIFPGVFAIIGNGREVIFVSSCGVPGSLGLVE